MISSINLEGNIARISELRTFDKKDGSKGAIISFAVAVNDSKRDGKGGFVDNTAFFNCKIWNKKAEAFAETFQVGDRVVISGDLEVREEWEDRDGNKHSGDLEVTVKSVGAALHFRPMAVDRSGRQSRSKDADAPEYTSKKTAAKKSTTPDFTIDSDDEDEEWSALI